MIIKIMDKFQKILNNRDYIVYLNNIARWEVDRAYCRHDLSHFLDVARIGLIISLQERLDIEKEIIYVAAILHDIGRWMEYRDGTPHELVSASLAAPILEDAGFNDEEIRQITQAILLHRNPGAEIREDICGVLYRADKLSRNCYMCKARPTCRKVSKNDGIKV